MHANLTCALQLVLNNFQQPPPGQPAKPELKLLTTMFQGLFPAIQVEKVCAGCQAWENRVLF